MLLMCCDFRNVYIYTDLKAEKTKQKYNKCNSFSILIYNHDAKLPYLSTVLDNSSL